MKVINLKATFESRASQKRAYEIIEKKCDRANKEVESFVKERINDFLKNRLGLTEESDLEEYRKTVIKKSGEDFDEYFITILDEKVFLFRIRKKTEEIDGNVTVSYLYEL